MTDPALPQKKPYVMDLPPGTYHWCACGFSKTQPYCDGSHASSGTGLLPTKLVLDQPTRIAWCGCKRSGRKPHCDGTHKNLP